MRHRSETELGGLVGELIADLERFRPGIPDAAPAEVQERIRARADLRLGELYAEYRIDERDGGAQAAASDAQLALYRREVDQLFVPRYAALALSQNQRERQRTDSGRGRAWQGPDLYNRLAYVALFFTLGLLVIRAPFIPIWEKWLPFALAALAPLCTPWLPDLYLSLAGRRHAIALGVLHMDLDHAGRALPLPPALDPAAAPRLQSPATAAAARSQASASATTAEKAPR